MAYYLLAHASPFIFLFLRIAFHIVVVGLPVSIASPVPTESVSLKLEGDCTERGVLVVLHYGAQEDLQWDLFLGARRLDWELAEMGRFWLEMEEDYYSVEIPFYSFGMMYEEVSLRGLVARVEVSVVDVESLKVVDRLVHKCIFPVRELLACLPEGRMVVIVDTSHTIPPTQPNRTTLLDPACVPLETDSARALFSFRPGTCGTTATTEGDFLLYENHVTYQQDFLPMDAPLIHREAPYRLTIQCRYPAVHSGTISMQQAANAALGRSTVPLDPPRREVDPWLGAVATGLPPHVNGSTLGPQVT